MSAPDPRLTDITFLRLAGMRALQRKRPPALPVPALPPEGLASLLAWYRAQTSAEVEAPDADAMSGLERLLAEAQEWLAEEQRQ